MKPMFQILFTDPNGRKWCKNCTSVEQKNQYVKKLTEAGVESEIIGEVALQICGCTFKSDGTLYTYVRVEGDAEPGNSGIVDVTDEYGRTIEKQVDILFVRETNIEECRAIAKALNRTKLVRIKKIWQRTLPY